MVSKGKGWVIFGASERSCFVLLRALTYKATLLPCLTSLPLLPHSTHHLHFIMAQWISSIHQILHIPPWTGYTTLQAGNKLVAMNWLHNPSGRLRRGVQGSYIHSHTAPSLAKILGPKTRPQAQSKTHPPETTEKSKQLKKKAKWRSKQERPESTRNRKKNNRRNNGPARKQTI